MAFRRDLPDLTEEHMRLPRAPQGTPPTNVYVELRHRGVTETFIGQPDDVAVWLKFMVRERRLNRVVVALAWTRDGKICHGEVYSARYSTSFVPNKHYILVGLYDNFPRRLRRSVSCTF